MVAMLLSNLINGFLVTGAASYSAATLRLHQINLTAFLGYVGDVEASAVKAQTIRLWLAYLQNDHEARRPAASVKGSQLSPSAVCNYFKSVRALFTWGVSAGVISKNPTAGVDRPRVPAIEPYPLSQKEIKKILDFAVHYYRGGRASSHPMAKRNLALLLLLLDTGLRAGEVCRLNVSDVNLDTADVIVRPFGSGMKSRSRVVPISPRTVRALWVFINSRILENGGSPLFGFTPTSLRKCLWSLGSRSGVPDVHPHRFRYTFAIEYLRNGGDPFTLQRILGHSNLEMVNRYLRVARSDLQLAHLRASPVDRWGL